MEKKKQPSKNETVDIEKKVNQESKEKTHSKKKCKLKSQPFVIGLLIILIVATIYVLHTILLFKGIETPMRIVASIIFIDLVALFSFIGFRIRRTRKWKYVIIFGILLLIYSGTIWFTSAKIKAAVFGTISKISKTADTVEHSSSLVARKDSTIKDLEDAKNYVVGYIDEEGNIAASDYPKQILEENNFDEKKLAVYYDAEGAIGDLLEGEIDAVFLPTEYTSWYSEAFENLEADTKIVAGPFVTTKEVEVDDKPMKSLEEPFTVLLVGEDNNTGGDTLADYDSKCS